MQVLNNILIKGRLLLESIAQMGSGQLHGLFLDQGEVKAKTLGNIVFKDQADYIDQISVSLPDIFNVTQQPTAAIKQLAAVLKSQTQKTVFAAPENQNGTPTFKQLTEEHIPTLSITKVHQLQEILDSFYNPYYYFEDNLTFDPNRFIRHDIPRHINLANHISLTNPGAYNFRVKLLLHANHRQFISLFASFVHHQLSATLIIDVTVLVDNTIGKTVRISPAKITYCDGTYLEYNANSTSVIRSGTIDERFFQVTAQINANTPRLQIGHSLHLHPGFYSMANYLVYGKYTVQSNSLNTSVTS